MVDVTNPKELRAWLDDLPHQAKIAFANRTGMRALPILLADPRFRHLPFSKSTSSFLISCLRSHLTSGVASTFPSAEIGQSLRTATRAAVSTFATFNSNSVELPTLAVIRSFEALVDFNPLDTNAILDIDLAAHTAAAALAEFRARDALNAAKADIGAIEIVADMSNLLTHPLWPGRRMPPDFGETWQSVRAKTHYSEWKFWVDWYQSFLDGKPMNWELQTQIAVIPDKDWEKGAKHIAQVIEEIRARFDLTKQLKTAEQKIAELEASRRGRGGNNPPELIEDDESAVILSVVRKSVEGLKEETEAGEPDPTRIQKILGTLRGFMAWIGNTATPYVGKKMDAFLQKFVESFGTAAGPVAAVALTGLGLEIAGVIESAEIWALILKKIGG